MQGKRPMNRKKNVTGQASQDSMNTHGAGRQDGPVGGDQGPDSGPVKKIRGIEHGHISFCGVIGFVGIIPFYAAQGKCASFPEINMTRRGFMV